MDSWFIAARPRSIFLYDWLQEFNVSLQYKTEKQYCDTIISQYPVPRQLINLLPYLTIHLCNWMIQYRNNKYNLYLMSSTETGAPLYYMSKHKFRSNEVIKDIKSNPIVQLQLFKIVGPFRSSLISQRKNYITNNKYIIYVFDNRF